MELCLYLHGVHKRKIYLLHFTFTVYSQLRLQMEFGGNVHTPATLPAGREFPVLTKREVGLAPEGVWTFRRQVKFLLLPAI